MVVIGAASLDRLGFTEPLSRGSAGALLVRDLALAPDDPRCTTGVYIAPDRRCPARYAFAPGREFSVWLTVRNTSAVDVTVDGVDEWLRQAPEDLLVRPVAALDGGSTGNGLTGDGTPFKPVSLAPGAERLIGIQMRTTSDLRAACAKWMPDTGMGWDEIPVTWHWLALQRATPVPLALGFQVMAPSARDCAGDR